MTLIPSLEKSKVKQKWIYSKNPIVEEILWDMTDRGGLKQEWGMIDNDIQKEIIVAWENIVEKHGCYGDLLLVSDKTQKEVVDNCTHCGHPMRFITYLKVDIGMFQCDYCKRVDIGMVN